MTISGALNNALSGLRAARTNSQVISSNLANALTPGYGPRSLELSASTASGGGVSAIGITRNVDPLLLSDRRLASADFGQRETVANFLDQLETLLGTPNEPSSFAARVSAFENSLITAASRPDAPDRLSTAVNSARDLVDTLKNTSDAIQEQRTRADRSIDEQVTRLNDALAGLQTLNGQITSAKIRGVDDASLLDLRQKTIDSISEIIPVRSVARQQGQVALYTTGGAIILDGSSVEFGFQSSNIVSAGMTQDNGALGGLTINGKPIDTGSDNSKIAGGTLFAQFKIRDELAPDAQEQLDAVARDLVERFADPSVDPTLGAGDPGLFTDSGTAFDPLDEVGLAGRLRLNSAVDPRQGGETWRIRDGLGAVVPGNNGDARLLQALGDALTDARIPASGDFGTSAYSANDLVTSMMSQISTDRANSDQHLTFAATVLNELKQQELNNGVDSDAELQNLLLVEQAYAANARLFQAADEMFQTLIGMV